MTTSTQIISAMITPALLIVGTGSLVATAVSRLGRIVDRARALSLFTPDDRQRLKIDDARLARWIEVYKRRATLVEYSVRSFFLGIAILVLDCLSIAVDTLFDGRIPWLPVSITIIGMVCMLVGSFLMVSETHLATMQVHDEIA